MLGEETDVDTEGCLIRICLVYRTLFIVRGYIKTVREKEIKRSNRLLAQGCIQHETDHLKWYFYLLLGKSNHYESRKNMNRTN